MGRGWEGMGRERMGATIHWELQFNSSDKYMYGSRVYMYIKIKKARSVMSVTEGIMEGITEVYHNDNNDNNNNNI